MSLSKKAKQNGAQGREFELRAERLKRMKPGNGVKESGGSVAVLEKPAKKPRSTGKDDIESLAAALGNVYIVAIDIVGISPLLMNNPASMEKVTPPGGVAPPPKNPTGEVEAAGKVYCLDDGQLYIPSVAFRSAMLSACKNRKLDNKKFATTIFKGAVFSAEDECRLVDATTGKPITKWKVDTRRVRVPPRTGASVPRSRPKIENWATTLVLEVDAAFLPDAQLILSVMNIAGRTIGVCDNRAEKGGENGRFRAKLRAI